MKRIPREIKTVVIFGGAGLVGTQVAREIAATIQPETLVICTLTKEEALPVIKKLKKEFPKVRNIHFEYGNVLVRENLAHQDRWNLIYNHRYLHTMFHDLFGMFNQEKDNVGQQNLMVKIIAKYKPDAVIDCINTATDISYQDEKTCSLLVKKFHDGLRNLIGQTDFDETLAKAKAGDKKAIKKVIGDLQNIKQLTSAPLAGFLHIDNLKMLELLLISEALPQLIRHVVLLYQALVAANTYAYIKVGTTGTGGMGANIPFTHGEDKPSFTLMAKTAVAFAHTGLLFLLSRAPNCPIFKEIKPGAMIGYKCFDFRTIYKNKKLVKKWQSKKENLKKTLVLHDDATKYQDTGDLKLVGIDAGESGFYTRAEFETITAANLMEFITPEEIARNVVFELIGNSTGKDVIAAIDGAITEPSYQAGLIRKDCVVSMRKMEQEHGIPSIAIGTMGPPQTSKLLYETYLLQQKYGTIAELAQDKITPAKLAQELARLILKEKDLQQMITSLGLPILLPDGKTILRGPMISVPEEKTVDQIKISSTKDIDTWAKRGWVDLRAANLQTWQKRAKKMLQSYVDPYSQGSARYHREAYTQHLIKTGEVVAWIFINEFAGYRVK